MKIRVTSIFRDKFTAQLYNPSEVIEIQDEERVQDLEDRKLAERVEEKKEVKGIVLFEREYEKKYVVEALKTIGEKATMNMKEETLIASVNALDEDMLGKLKDVLEA